MTKRKMFIAIIRLIAVAALTTRTGAAEPADSCVAKPNTAPPQGSHWYYRVDRTANRRCWYLGPEGLKVREAQGPKQSISATSTLPPDLASRVEATASQNGVLVPPVPTPASDAASLNDNLDEHMGIAFQADMPLKVAELPTQVLAAEPRPGAEAIEREALSAAAESAAFLSLPAQIVTTLAGAFALLIILLLFMPFVFRKSQAPRTLQDQRRPIANAVRPRTTLSAALDTTAAAGRKAEIARELSRPRGLSAAREALNPARAPEERRLLYNSHRNAA